jgi:uncharacterized membrane protein
MKNVTTRQSSDIQTVQKLVTSIVVASAVVAGTITGLVQFHERTVHRKKWAIPRVIVILLIVAGFVGAIVERVIDAQPSLRCINGSSVGVGANSQCSAILSTTVTPGAVARCNDNTYSFSHDVSNRCSRHGGVRTTL